MVIGGTEGTGGMGGTGGTGGNVGTGGGTGIGGMDGSGGKDGIDGIGGIGGGGTVFIGEAVLGMVELNVGLPKKSPYLEEQFLRWLWKTFVCFCCSHEQKW